MQDKLFLDKNFLITELYSLLSIIPSNINIMEQENLDELRNKILNIITIIQNCPIDNDKKRLPRISVSR